MRVQWYYDFIEKACTVKWRKWLVYASIRGIKVSDSEVMVFAPCYGGKVTVVVQNRKGSVGHNHRFRQSCRA